MLVCLYEYLQATIIIIVPAGLVHVIIAIIILFPTAFVCAVA